MIVWTHGWREYDLPENESYFLRELRREVQDNSAHPLFGKELRIAGWVRGDDDFMLYLPFENRYAYVHLTWNAECESTFPHCEFLNDHEAVNRFVQLWAGED